MLYSSLVHKLTKRGNPVLYSDFNELLEEGNYLPIHVMDIDEVIHKDVPPELTAIMKLWSALNGFSLIAIMFTKRIHQ